MIEAEFGFFEMVVEEGLGDAVEFCQSALGVTPETLDTVDMMFARCEPIAPVMYP